jgi:hypothetical protein
MRNTRLVRWRSVHRLRLALAAAASFALLMSLFTAVAAAPAGISFLQSQSTSGAHHPTSHITQYLYKER